MVRKRIVLIILIVAILLILLGLFVTIYTSTEAQAQDRHFLWHVRSGEANGFILGSVHVMKQDDYPLSRIIENAFEQSEALAVEVNINEMDPAALQRLAGEAFYKEGDSLDKHVSVSTLSLLQKKTEAMGLNFEIIKRQKPWFLVTTLPAMALLKAGYDPQYGIDMHFLSRAKGKKKIIELESLALRMKLLSGFTPRQQEVLLTYTLEELSAASQEAQDLIEAWKSGNLLKMDELATKSFKGDPRLEPVFTKLLSERNQGMASRIESVMKAQDNCLFIVGAAHLVGEKSIIRLLQGKGMILKQL